MRQIRAGHGDRVGIDRSFFLSADEVNDTKCERAGSGRGEVDIAGAAVRTETSLGHGFITGSGAASKEQVQEMLRRILSIPREDLDVQLDATDALGAALCFQGGT